jgi:hypothetical protein
MLMGDNKYRILRGGPALSQCKEQKRKEKERWKMTEG